MDNKLSIEELELLCDMFDVMGKREVGTLKGKSVPCELSQQLKVASDLNDKAFLITDEMYTAVTGIKTPQNRETVKNIINNIIDIKNIAVYNQLVLTSVIRVLKFLNEVYGQIEQEEKENGKKH